MRLCVHGGSVYGGRPSVSYPTVQVVAVTITIYNAYLIVLNCKMNIASWPSIDIPL